MPCDAPGRREPASVRVRAAPWDAPGLSRGRARRAPPGEIFGEALLQGTDADIDHGGIFLSSTVREVADEGDPMPLSIQEISDRIEVEQLRLQLSRTPRRAAPPRSAGAPP